MTVPPTLSDSYTPISDTIASHSALPSPSGAESKHPPHELAPPFATKQIGRWVAVANVQSRIVVQQELSIEDEVRECFDQLRGKRSFCSTSATIQYSPISSVPRQALPHPSQLRKYQHLPLFHGPIRARQRSICHLLWDKPASPCMRRRTTHFSHTRPFGLRRIRRTQPLRATSPARPRSQLLGTREHRSILASHHRSYRTHILFSCVHITH